MSNFCIFEEISKQDGEIEDEAFSFYFEQNYMSDFDSLNGNKLSRFKSDAKPIGWRTTVEFDTQKHLFSDTIKTDYELDAYSCSCGNQDFVVKAKLQAIDYACPECQNNLFYCASSVVHNFCIFLEQNPDVTLPYIDEISYDRSSITMSLITTIPANVDFQNNVITNTNVVLFSITAHLDGTFSSMHLVKFRQKIFDCMHSTLAKRIYHSKDFYYFSYWDYVTYDLKTCKNLQDVVLKITNGRYEKSLKKFVFKKHNESIQAKRTFNPFFINVFTRKISDINFILKFLELDLQSIREIKKYLEDYLDYLQRHYQDRQILHLFSQLNDEDSIVMLGEIFTMLSQLNSAQLEEPISNSCSLIPLYDSLCRITNDTDRVNKTKIY